MVNKIINFALVILKLSLAILLLFDKSKLKYFFAKVRKCIPFFLHVLFDKKNVLKEAKIN